MSTTAPSLAEIAAEAAAFRDGFKTLHLATVSTAGTPCASYAPYALSSNGDFYVLVSELAPHTANLLAGHPVHVLLIESEEAASHIFARRRLSLACSPRLLADARCGRADAVAALRARFGDFVDYLAGLSDFHAFALRPGQGSYVRGFAQAYEFEDGQLELPRHVNDRGHRARA